MIKLIIFDIDNTLAQINKPIQNQVINFLKWIDSLGIKIALISGKPTVYISGLVRQIGLMNPIICGENGAVIHYSSNLPPRREIRLIADNGGIKLKQLRLSVLRKFGNTIWIQPNLVNLTIFPKSERVKYKLFEFVTFHASNQSLSKSFKIYKHADSIELVPLNVDKGVALKKIRVLEKLKREEVIAVGDGENDIPMFKEASVSIGINLPAAKYNFSNIKRAIEFIRELIKKEQANV